MLDYEKDISIDPDALDVEWLNHSNLARRYSKHAAHLRRLAMQAEENVKVIKAELINEVSQDPEASIGKDKAVAADIESYYRRSKRHKRAKQEWIDAVYEANYAEMVQKEFAFGRKASLENLVALFIAQYFAGPKVPRNINEEWERRQRQDKSDQTVKDGFRRTK